MSGIIFRAGSCSAARPDHVEFYGALIPSWLVEKATNPPAEGGGLHDWTYATARQLHAHFSEDQIIAILTDATTTLDLSPKRRSGIGREIRQAAEHSLLNAYQFTKGTAGKRGQQQRKLLAKNGGAVVTSGPLWPEIDPAQIAAVVAEIGGSVEDLRKLSPAQFEGEESNAEEIIDMLFPADSLLCVGRSSFDFGTLTREELRGHLAELPLIVPSPMIAQFGRTQDGKESEHTLENTGPRRFLVIECDPMKWEDLPPDEQSLYVSMEDYYRIKFDEQASVAMHLARLAPLALVVHSGGKSLHSWFYCAGESEEMLFDFMKYARTLGADKATRTRSQFVRMPDGKRETGERQRALYLNPEVVK